MTDGSRFVVNIDGGARGNPGPAGWGAVVRDADGTIVTELAGALPHATNNVAEYHALLAVLDWCVDQGARSVHVRSDSELLVQQMRGAYKVRNEGLKPLHGRARLVADRIGRVTYEHVRRELNTEADRLANKGMDDAERLTLETRTGEPGTRNLEPGTRNPEPGTQQEGSE